MTEFKVDDRVRCVNDFDSGGGLVSGQQYTIARVYDTHVALFEVAFSWSASRFELVESAPSTPSPVRKVTRTEIVPGIYGGVEVRNVATAGVLISYNEYASASELRSAARIFNEIADALDQSKEAS